MLDRRKACVLSPGRLRVSARGEKRERQSRGALGEAVRPAHRQFRWLVCGMAMSRSNPMLNGRMASR